MNTLLKKPYNVKKRRRILLLELALILLVLLPLATTSTYTWITISKTPRVTNLTLYVNAHAGLGIAWNKNSEEWGQHLNFGDVFGEDTILKPVTYSDKNDAFYAAILGHDGRIASISDELSDERHTNRNDSEGYYVKFTFYAHTDENVTVSLAKAAEHSGTYVTGAIEWDEEKLRHYSAGYGAEQAIRIGFRITKYGVDGMPVEEAPTFLIYEPNGNIHIDGPFGYENTSSIDGGESLVPDDRLIKQMKTGWQEADPVQRDKVTYWYGDFLTETKLFDLDADCTAQIEVYLWLEGMDKDCCGRLSEDAKIFANLQFWSESRINTGTETIK